MNDDRIVKWAPRASHIGLRCKVCGARFFTKNIGYVGARTIHMEMGSLKKCFECDNAGHTLADLEIVKGGETVDESI